MSRVDDGMIIPLLYASLFLLPHQMSRPDVERIDYNQFDDALDIYLHQRRYALAISTIQGNRILDLGCGYGYGTKQMALAHPDKQFDAIDIDPEVITYAKNHNQLANITYHSMSATELTFDDSSFDTVISIENIEHIPDDQAYLAEARRVLKPQGVFFVTTPNDNRLPHRIKGVFNIPFQYNEFHIREYTPAQLVRALQRNGFHIEKQQGLYLHLLPRGTRGGRRLSQLPIVYKLLVNHAPFHLASYQCVTATK